MTFEQNITTPVANNIETLVNNSSCTTFKVGSTKFKANNWKRIENNAVLNELEERGMAVWITPDGDYAFRRSINGEITIIATASRLNKVLTSTLGRRICVGDDDTSDIKSNEFEVVSDNIFDPTLNQEFVKIDGETFRNKFRPTRYMELNKNTPYQEPTAILLLLSYLVKGNVDRLKWVINWLAYFFQGLKKSPVALVLKGDQGAGKGIFHEYVLVPLYGKAQCIQINDKSFKGNFIASMLEARLVINLDEISSSTADNKEVKNKLKAIISNNFATFEKKHVNLEKETQLFGMVLVTSNEPKALDIESKDRRFTVMTTGGNIANENFLGYGSHEALLEAIESELEDFALMLMNYNVDKKMATTALNTPEKEALVGISSTRYEEFAKAIKTKNYNFFEGVDPIHYSMIEESFQKNRVSKRQLTMFFNATFGGNLTAHSLLKQLRTIDPVFFSDENTMGRSNGDRMFILDGGSNIIDVPVAINVTPPALLNDFMTAV